MILGNASRSLLPPAGISPPAAPCAGGAAQTAHLGGRLLSRIAALGGCISARRWRWEWLLPWAPFLVSTDIFLNWEGWRRGHSGRGSQSFLGARRTGKPVNLGILRREGLGSLRAPRPGALLLFRQCFEFAERERVSARGEISISRRNPMRSRLRGILQVAGLHLTVL